MADFYADEKVSEDMLGNWLTLLYKYHPSLNNQPKPSDYPPQQPPQVGLTDLRNRIPNRGVTQTDARNLLRLPNFLPNPNGGATQIDARNLVGRPNFQQYPDARSLLRPQNAQPFRDNLHRRNFNPNRNPAQGFRDRRPRTHRGYFNPKPAPAPQYQQDEQQGHDFGCFRDRQN